MKLMSISKPAFKLNINALKIEINFFFLPYFLFCLKCMELWQLYDLSRVLGLP